MLMSVCGEFFPANKCTLLTGRPYYCSLGDHNSLSFQKKENTYYRRLYGFILLCDYWPYNTSHIILKSSKHKPFSKPKKRDCIIINIELLFFKKKYFLVSRSRGETPPPLGLGFPQLRSPSRCTLR